MYYILFAIFYLLSLLPFFVLYGLSDLLTFLLYHIFKYRREVVMNNLKIAFPEKSEKELTAISKKFYRNFNDTWMESIKLMSISMKRLNKRITSDTNVFREIKKSGRPCQLYMAHTFNWEWANVHTAAIAEVPFLGVYQPISNKAVDRLFKYFRDRSGTILLPANEMRKAMLPWRDKQYVLGLIADQNPGRADNAYWVNFFNKKAPFVKGPEKYAKFNNAVIVFCRMEHVKRGHYKMTFDLITTEPKSTGEGELTLKFVRYIEDAIRHQPEIYLWSHRRWRHEWKEEYRANTLE